MSTLNWVAAILTIIGGLNWGLVGAFKFNLVSAILGDMSTVSRVVYVLVGLSALYMLAMLPKMGKSSSSQM